MTNCDIQTTILALTIKSAKVAVQLYFAPLRALWTQVRRQVVALDGQWNPTSSNIATLNVDPLLNSRTLKDMQSSKRIFDIFFAFVLLIVFAPLLLTTAVLIKLTSKGPVLWSYVRLGKNGRTFRALKFRTLYVNPASVQNEATVFFFSMMHDPRITPIGRVLRRWGLDELPSLLNILRGEMSFVGPRPLPAQVYLEISEITNLEIIEWLRLRSTVTPGLIGLWQVRRPPAVEFVALTAMDIEYVRERSLMLDLKIVLSAMIAVLAPSAERRTVTARTVDELTECELRKLAHVH